MNVNQHDIVEIAFYNGKTPQAHPAIVLSKNEIFEAEGFFYAVLLSTKNLFPDFTLEVNPEMINKPRNNRSGYAVCHMIQQFYIEDIISKTGSSIKLNSFKDIISKINEVIFSLD